MNRVIEIIRFIGDFLYIMCRPRLATLLNVHYRLSSKNIVFASARTHCIVYANPVFLKRLGRSEKEFRTKAFLEFVHPEDKGPTLDQMARLADGDPTVNVYQSLSKIERKLYQRYVDRCHY